MQNFRDTSTGRLWAFEDDVVVTLANGVYSFTAPHGVPLDVPNTLQPYTPPAPSGPTLVEQAESLIAQGLSITSTSTLVPATTWPTDPTTQGKMLRLATVVNRLNSFPNGATVWPVVDLTGTVHSLTVAQFTAVEGACAGFVASCDLIFDNLGTVLPSREVTIP